MRKSVTFRLCCIAILSALSIVCNMYSITITPDISISFTYVVAFLSGVFLGPIDGFAVGAIGDGIGCIIAPKGPYAVTVTISSALMGVLFWFIFRFCRKLPVYVRIVLGYLLVFVVCSVLINTTTWYFMYSSKANYFAYLFSRNVFQIIVVAVNCALTCALFMPISKVMSKFGFEVTSKKVTNIDKPTEDK